MNSGRALRQKFKGETLVNAFKKMMVWEEDNFGEIHIIRIEVDAKNFTATVYYRKKAEEK